MNKTARMDIRTTPEARDRIRALWRQTFAQHGLSFGDWVVQQVLKESKP